MNIAFVVLYSILALFGFMIIAFFVGTIKKNNGLVDGFYGLGYIVLNLICFLLTGTFYLRQILSTILVVIWGIRLAVYVFKRNIGKPEDYRYQDMRRRWGDKVLLKSFYRIYIFQGIIIILVSTPVLYTNIASPTGLVWIDFIGLLVWIFGFYFESIGDYQLQRFKANPENKGKVMDQGLWKYTQHPNYFGEVTQWWGLYILTLSVPFGFITIVGPILITYFIIKVSGIKLLNKRFDGNDKYAEYKKKTSTFIPRPPKE